MTVLAQQPILAGQGVLIPSGGPLIGQEYIRIYDQSGQLWTWWISTDLVVQWAPSPEHDFDQEVRYYLVPWWLELVDADGVVWYLYPALDGSPFARVNKPPLGDGLTGAPPLRVRGGPQRYRYRVVGGDIDVAAL